MTQSRKPGFEWTTAALQASGTFEAGLRRSSRACAWTCCDHAIRYARKRWMRDQLSRVQIAVAGTILSRKPSLPIRLAPRFSWCSTRSRRPNASRLCYMMCLICPSMRLPRSLGALRLPPGNSRAAHAGACVEGILFPTRISKASVSLLMPSSPHCAPATSRAFLQCWTRMLWFALARALEFPAPLPRSVVRKTGRRGRLHFRALPGSCNRRLSMERWDSCWHHVDGCLGLSLSRSMTERSSGLRSLANANASANSTCPSSRHAGIVLIIASRKPVAELKVLSSGALMLESFEFVAILSCALFSGAALYINVAEHPARMQCGTELATTVFGPSYHRAA